jgi:maleate isomerase
VLDEEGRLLIRWFPGVTLRLAKLDHDPNAPICTSTYIHCLESGELYTKAALLARTPFPVTTVIGMACTSLSFILGSRVVQSELKRGFPSARTMDMAEAQIEALKALGATHIALLTPYIEELASANASMLVAHAGVIVVARHTMCVPIDSMTSSVSPAEIARLIHRINVASAQVIVIGCSAFRACGPGFITDLEKQVGKPIVTSTQAYLWWMLRVAGISDQVQGYGRLFSHY